MVIWPEDPASEVPLSLDLTEGAPANYRQTLVKPIRFATYATRGDVLLVRLLEPCRPTKWQVFKQQLYTNEFDYCFLATSKQGSTLFDRVNRPIDVYWMLANSPVALKKTVLDENDITLQGRAVLSPKY